MRKENINSLSGIKVIAMLLLFWWHSEIPDISIDLGARTCEILFILSGFLFAYNHYDKASEGTWKESWYYIKGKLVSFYPLHVLTALIIIVFVEHPKKSVLYFLKAFLNFTLLQAWSPMIDVAFSLNNVSWFLSALIFCYFLAIPFLNIIKKFTLKQNLFLYCFVVLVRFLFEYMNVNYPNEVGHILVHTNPIIRFFEFFIGMLIFPFYTKLSEMIKNIEYKKIILSISEIVLTTGLIWVMYKMNNASIRVWFVVLLCGPIIAFALNGGIISSLLGNKVFMFLSGIQFEFYMLHVAVLRVFNPYLIGRLGWKNASIIEFAIIVISGYIYKKYFAKIFSNNMQKILRFNLERLTIKSQV